MSLHGVKQSWDISSERFFSFSDKATSKGLLSPGCPGRAFSISSPAQRATQDCSSPGEDVPRPHGWRTHLRGADKTGPYPGWAKPSVLVVLRVRRSPQRRQPRLRMSRPCRGTAGSRSSVGCAGCYCMARPSEGIPASRRAAP